MRYVVKNEDGLYLAPKDNEETWVKFLSLSRIFNNPLAANNAMIHTPYDKYYRVHKVRITLGDPVE